MKLTTTMSFAYGHWTCRGCGYADENGYPCFCIKCGAENITSPKSPDKMVLPKVEPPKPIKIPREKRIQKPKKAPRPLKKEPIIKGEIQDYREGESTWARLERRRKELNHNF